jgi:hypothetical protein
MNTTGFYENELLSYKQNQTSLTSVNNEAKSRLSSAVNTTAQISNDNHVFTKAEISKMSPAQFKKNEKKIFDQMSKGLIK